MRILQEISMHDAPHEQKRNVDHLNLQSPDVPDVPEAFRNLASPKYRHRIRNWIAIGSTFYLGGVLMLILFYAWFISIMLPPGKVEIAILLPSLFPMFSALIAPLLILNVLCFTTIAIANMVWR